MSIRLSIALALALSGCGHHVALRGIPTLTDGTQSRWVYHCVNGNLAVEYANRGGRYTVLIETQDSKQVLDVIERGDNRVVAALESLRWESQDGVLYVLSDADRVVLDGCRAIQQQERGNIHLNLSGRGKK